VRLAYYPGCSLDATSIEYGMSTQRMAKLLGIDLWEIPDWNCCGASSAHQTNHLLALSLPARNLAIAEKEGLDTLAPCAACYNRMRATEYEVRASAKTRSQVEEAIGMPFQATQNSVSVLELLAERYGLDNLASKVTKPLKGMTPACYYGCLLVRPVAITGFDDPEDPQSMDNIMKTLGASPVDWAFKTECCGAGLGVTQTDICLEMTYRILKNAKDMGADSIVTACPVCHLNLDMRQKVIEKKYQTEFNLPVYYVTELVAIACGDEPPTVGTNRHFVDANSPQSKVLANCIQDEMVRILGNNKRKAKEGVFYIMEKTTMPTVIIEVGFISNPREERMLMDELYQTRIAYAIMSGLVKYSGKEAIP
jgi:heterodisulfide reductase subunit B